METNFILILLKSDHKVTLLSDTWDGTKSTGAREMCALCLTALKRNLQCLSLIISIEP